MFIRYSHSISLCIFLTLTFTTIKSEVDAPFWLPQKPSLRFHNNEPIKLKQGSYEALVTRWQKRLTKSWDTFYTNLNNDTGITPELLDVYINDANIANIYSSAKEKEASRLQLNQDEANIDPIVLDYIKRIVHRYCTKKNIKIIITPHINTITATFGSDQNTHYLLCHAGIYTPEHIKHIYESLGSPNGAFYIEKSPTKSLRFIELSNFLLIGLIEAASHIQHQSNLLTFFISNISIEDIRPSDKTIQSCWHITEIRGILESILQSKNPLEAALFIGKTRNRNAKEKALWQQFIKDLADCYEPESLELFRASIREINYMYKS